MQEKALALSIKLKVQRFGAFYSKESDSCDDSDLGDDEGEEKEEEEERMMSMGRRWSIRLQTIPKRTLWMT